MSAAAPRSSAAFALAVPVGGLRTTFSGARVQTCLACEAPVGAATAARRRRRVVMQLGAPAPKTAIGRPKTSIEKSVGNVTNTPEREPETGGKGAKARPTRKTLSDEVPMFKVVLLGDTEYEEGHVTTQLQKICQVDKGKASKCFQEAQQSGSSVVVVVPEEHAEFYAQQLKRAEIFVTIEKEYVRPTFRFRPAEAAGFLLFLPAFGFFRAPTNGFPLLVFPLVAWFLSTQ